MSLSQPTSSPPSTSVPPALGVAPLPFPNIPTKLKNLRLDEHRKHVRKARAAAFSNKFYLKTKSTDIRVQEQLQARARRHSYASTDTQSKAVTAQVVDDQFCETKSVTTDHFVGESHPGNLGSQSIDQSRVSFNEAEVISSGITCLGEDNHSSDRLPTSFTPRPCDVVISSHAQVRSTFPKSNEFFQNVIQLCLPTFFEVVTGSEMNGKKVEVIVNSVISIVKSSGGCFVWPLFQEVSSEEERRCSWFRASDDLITLYTLQNLRRAAAVLRRRRGEDVKLSEMKMRRSNDHEHSYCPY